MTADFAEIARQFHGVNVKLMKAGGYRRGIELLRRTRAHGHAAHAGLHGRNRVAALSRRLLLAAWPKCTTSTAS